MLGKETLIPYSRPPLTKEFLRGELDASELPIEEPSWFDEHDIQLRLGYEVTAIDPSTGAVHADGYALRADAIVLATGAEPSAPDLPGLDDPRVQTMRERPDSERIASQAKPGTHTIVLGTGFIGCELAASLAQRGAQVTLVGQEPAPQQQRLGAEAAERIARWLADLGVTLHDGREGLRRAQRPHRRAQPRRPNRGRQRGARHGRSAPQRASRASGPYDRQGSDPHRRADARPRPGARCRRRRATPTTAAQDDGCA